MASVTILPHKKIAMIGPSKVKPALCLDLDGTVRFSKNGEFINKPEDIALFDGVEEKIWQYRNEGYLILGITNQGGVAYGYKTPRDTDAELDATIALFQRNPFHFIQSCYHHEKGTVEPYCHRSLFRKPDIGMLAMHEVEAYEAGFIVDWDNSLFVGDRPEDKECAERANIKFQWAFEFFNRCAKCNQDLGHLSLADLVIPYADLKFCSSFCLDMWLDAKQEEV